MQNGKNGKTQILTNNIIYVLDFGSQFFIMHQDYPLPPSYTIFAHVISGQDVVDAVATTQTGASDRPITPVVINKVSIK